MIISHASYLQSIMFQNTSLIYRIITLKPIQWELIEVTLLYKNQTITNGSKLPNWTSEAKSIYDICMSASLMVLLKKYIYYFL